MILTFSKLTPIPTLNFQNSDSNCIGIRMECQKVRNSEFLFTPAFPSPCQATTNKQSSLFQVKSYLLKIACRKRIIAGTALYTGMQAKFTLEKYLNVRNILPKPHIYLRWSTNKIYIYYISKVGLCIYFHKQNLLAQE